jgi:hypothetical protein
MSYVMIQLDDVDGDNVSINIDFKPELPENYEEVYESLTPAQKAGVAVASYLINDVFAQVESDQV